MIGLEVLYEDNHCLAVQKPAGLLSQGDRTGEPSLVDAASHYLKTHYAKPGNVYVGLLHRLDRPASGVMLIARTSKAAARLSEQFRSGLIEKVYWAIVEGSPGVESGTWTDVVTKDSHTNRAAAYAEANAAGKEASVDFRILNQWQVLEVRAQAALGAEPSASRAARIPRVSDPRRLQVWIKCPAEGARRAFADRPARATDHLHASDSS